MDLKKKVDQLLQELKSGKFNKVVSDGEKLLILAERDEFSFVKSDSLGSYVFDDSFNDQHIEHILNLELVNVDLVKKSGFKVVVDAVNSTGGFMVPKLLEKMGVKCVKLFCEPNGNFSHNPEPLAEHLEDLSNLVVKSGADFGIAVDPDVERLALVCED